MENIFKMNVNNCFDEKTIEKIRETVERINNKEIGMDEVIKHYYTEKNKDVKEEEKMIFEDAFDLCDYEIQCRYNYLDQLLCECDDRIMYLTEDLEKAKVDSEIAVRLVENNIGVDGETLSNSFRIEKIQKEIDYLYEKYEIVLDMFDEVFFGILANIE